MGAADIVPGVSGGTVALVFGIYERLIGNVRQGAHVLSTAVRGRPGDAIDELREIEWVWLVSLLAGILTAVIVLASTVERLLHEQPVRLGGLFFGLIVGSIIVSVRVLRSPDATTAAIALGVGAIFFLLLGLRTETESVEDEIANAPLWAFFLAGSIAICAMILPGISGSLMLVMMGMYGDVLGAVNDRDLLLIGTFGVGCVIGLASFSTLLSWLLEHHHDKVLGAMIGLMIGSLRVLWPWPGGTSTTELTAPRGDIGVPILLATIGLLVVLGVEWIGHRMTSGDDAPASIH